jgi:hypothetical protein
MGTGIDALAIGNCILLKARQDPARKQEYAERFRLD